MSRINYIGSARKSPGACGRCSTVIVKGEPYSFVEFFRGSKSLRCQKCKFKRSETVNSKMSAVYAAGEAAEELLAQWDGKDADALKTILDDAAEAVREVIEEYQAVADEHPNLASANEERIGELESLADDLEGFDVEEFEAERHGSLEDWATSQREEAAATLFRFSEV